jgi:hypothetical protein
LQFPPKLKQSHCVNVKRAAGLLAVRASVYYGNRRRLRGLLCGDGAWRFRNANGLRLLRATTMQRSSFFQTESDRSFNSSPAVSQQANRASA